MGRKQVRNAAGSAGSKYALASRSLIGEGRQYIRALNEALLLLLEGCSKKPGDENVAGTEEAAAAAEVAAAAATTTSARDETMESGKPNEAVVGTRAQGTARKTIFARLSLGLLFRSCT